MTGARTAALLALVGALLCACGADEGAERGVVAPRPVLGVVPSDGEGLGEGSHVVRLDAAHPGAAPVPLAAGLAAVGAPAVRHDAARWCFLGRASAGAPVRLYLADLPEGQPRALEAAVDAASAPAWLPDGCLVYAAPALDGSRALYRLDPEHGAPERITFSGTDAADPCVLRDGRVLYAGTRVTPEGRVAPALYAVHADGVGLALFHAATPGVRYARPRQREDGDVLFLCTDDQGRAQPRRLDWRAPLEPGVPLEAYESLDVVPATLWPALGLRRVVDAGPRPRPQGHSSLLKEGSAEGTLLCLDARHAGPQDAAFASFAARVEDAEHGAYAWKPLGRVALEPDGSFQVLVPADTPLRLDLLAADGSVRLASRTPFWVRPGEVRGCTGCHESPDTTPPNRQPAAARHDAVRPAAAPRKEGS